MKLWGRCIVQNLGRVRIWGVIASLGAHPQNVALGYDVGDISTSCLVSTIYDCCQENADHALRRLKPVHCTVVVPLPHTVLVIVNVDNIAET